MTETMERDELGERLIEAELAPNGFILDLNHSLTVPYGWTMPAPWDLPSRLFRFPIEVSEARNGRPRRIGLMHPELGEHPFVQHVEGLGFEVDPDGAPNAYGVSKTSTGMWWHAVDLISAGMWRELLATRRFTTPANIAGAVAYGLDYSSHHEGRKRNGHITTAEAREIMRAIGVDEPTDANAILREFMRPTACKSDGSAERWPINHAGAEARQDRAWGRIIGIERGWFGYDRAGFLQWTPAGRDRYDVGDAPTFVEATGQGGFAF